MSEVIIDQALEYIDYQILNPPDDDYVAYGDGFPQDETSQGVERIKVSDISRPFDPGFQNTGHVPLTKTHSGESITSGEENAIKKND
jgi:hypothetical protein